MDGASSREDDVPAGCAPSFQASNLRCAKRKGKPNLTQPRSRMLGSNLAFLDEFTSCNRNYFLFSVVLTKLVIGAPYLTRRIDSVAWRGLEACPTHLHSYSSGFRAWQVPKTHSEIPYPRSRPLTAALHS